MKFCVQLTGCIDGFCTDYKANRGYLPKDNQFIELYKGSECVYGAVGNEVFFKQFRPPVVIQNVYICTKKSEVEIEFSIFFNVGWT
jgi:hypothetical protein